jgi:predicted DNA-binding transcriptional regulator AlpA
MPPSHEQFESVATADNEPVDRIAITESEHLTLDETAEWLRCSTRTLQRLLETGRGPPLIRISERRLIFRKADLRRWLAGQTTGGTDFARPRRSGRTPKAGR